VVGEAVQIDNGIPGSLGLVERKPVAIRGPIVVVYLEILAAIDLDRFPILNT
jgi:hypothetical protein